MSYSFQRTYLLAQQTPLIHFQYDQDGATLRATEVKPKLDAYLAGVCAIEKDWKIDADSDALQYRLMISAPENEVPEISRTKEYDIELHKIRDRIQKKEFKKTQKRNYRLIHAMYFANMAKDNQRQEQYEQEVNEKYKETVFYHGYITLTVLCRIDRLMQAIDENLEGFFAVHNFGTRQSKGFGGFKLVRKKEDAAWKPSNMVQVLRKEKIPFFYLTAQHASTEDLMNHAMTVYAVMKGGINMKLLNPAGSVQGYIQRAFLKDGHQINSGSEKAFLNERMFSRRETSDEKEYWFMRALLGLPDHYEYRHHPVFNGTVKVYSLGEESFDVERFHSPVTIKIIDSGVFFLFRPVREILGKEFYFIADEDVQKQIDSEKAYSRKKALILQYAQSLPTPCTIKTPSGMDWNAFIDGFLAYFRSDAVADHLGACGFPYYKTCGIQLVKG